MAKPAAAISLLVVTAMWVAGRPAATGPGDLGRLAALWSTDLLLIQVMLMARIPWVERAYGQDTLARWHRWTGFASFLLLVAHVALAVTAFAARDGSHPLRQVWELATYPGMFLAWAGFAALVLVVWTSTRGMRRSLRYESWHLLHLYAYLGVGLAVPHELALGDDFRSPAARGYWWCLYLVAVGSILVFRVGLPIRNTLRHRLTVDHVDPEAPGLVSVYLRGRRLDRLPVRAGQYFVWRFLDGRRAAWRGHPFSLSGPPRSDALRITVKTVGDGTSRVAALRPGTRALIEGPFGRMTAATYHGGPVTMLACGVGVTPLLALLWDLPFTHGAATLVYRTRRPDEVAFLSELEWLAEHRGVRLVPLVGPRAAPGSWLPAGFAEYSDAQALLAIAPDIAAHAVYVCGPDPWAEAVFRAARTAGVPAAGLHRERFAW